MSEKPSTWFIDALKSVDKTLWRAHDTPWKHCNCFRETGDYIFHSAGEWRAEVLSECTVDWSVSRNTPFQKIFRSVLSRTRQFF